jgi:hypothetical protein
LVVGVLTIAIIGGIDKYRHGWPFAADCDCGGDRGE